MGEGKGMNGIDLNNDSVAALFVMQCHADLEHQFRVAKRDGVPDERLIPFFAVMPDGLSDTERAKWTREISEGLEALTADAHRSIMVDRTLATMKDLGLGDDGDGGTRHD